MMFPKKKQNRFQLAFKKKEISVYIPMEEYLIDDLDIPTRSDTQKNFTLETIQAEKTGTSGDSIEQL